MTPLEAALLALVGRHHRSLQSALTRIVQGRPTEEDAQVPRLLPAETRLDWMVRLSSSADTFRTRTPYRSFAPLLTIARGQLARARRLDIWPLALGGDGFPPRLAEITEPPPIIWGRGTRGDLVRQAVALVGSRSASTYGRAMARRLAAELASAGVVVVSGLARGVDAAAHQGALDAGGRTIAVLGSGVDRIYPPEHERLAAIIEAAGAVISEFAPGTPPRSFHFPMRNRLISGLSSVVVVVEAPEKSGALITAATALEQGRDVMVVPGPVLGGRNRGGHALARDGAKLVECADDILGDLRPMKLLDSGVATGADPHPVLRHMTEGIEYTVDEVSNLTARPLNTTMAELLELELSGKIQRVGGARFIRCAGRS
jgi:DNA processing protein